MKTLLKRTLAALLVVAMLFTLCAVALADDEELPVADPDAIAAENTDAADATDGAEDAIDADDVATVDVETDDGIMAVAEEAEPQLPEETEPTKPAATAEIQVNGVLIDFPSGVEPFYDTAMGRVFVPFRDLFTALGAEVDYIVETNTAVAVRDDVTVEYVLNSDEFTFTKTGEEPVQISDVLTVNTNGRILVPVRFVSESIGIKVGWDNTTRTVLIVDPYLLNGANEYTYETVAELMAADLVETDETKNYATKADATFNLSLTDALGTLEIPANITVDAVTSADAIDAKVNIKADLTSIFGSVLPGFSTTCDIDTDIIFNAKTGVLAVQSDGLFALAEQFIGIKIAPAGAWVTLDALAVVGDAAETVTVGADDDFKTIIDAATVSVVESMTLRSVDDYAAVAEAVDAVQRLLSDESLLKNDDGYTLSAELDLDGAQLVLDMTLATDEDGKIVSSAVEVKLADGADSMSLSIFADDAAVKIALALKQGGLNIAFETDASMTETTAKPRTKHPAGVQTVDLSELLAPGLLG